MDVEEDDDLELPDAKRAKEDVDDVTSALLGKGQGGGEWSSWRRRSW